MGSPLATSVMEARIVMNTATTRRSKSAATADSYVRPVLGLILAR